MILTTMCYIQKEKQTLLLHRVKKKTDINSGKWIGVGGKFETGESAEECMKREIFEETGLKAQKLQLQGFVSFPGIYYGEDELMFVYTCHEFSGEIHECDEGILQWIDNDKIASLPMWEGDYHFFEWLKDDKIHSAKIVYENDHVIEYQEESY
ncbi:MAG: 8-oxo-dGTP diphosphatase [Coprobacillus sp.]|nr:8-oxo-dGTP diphosphatase [Coprobacillus sp.]MCI9092886.1 8-oxo-dGTP diphosphatase [Coprobacillus sp.]